MGIAVRRESADDAIRRLQRYADRLEYRYELSSSDMDEAVRCGRIKETAEVGLWLSKFHLLKELRARQASVRTTGTPNDSYRNIHHNYIERLTREGLITRHTLSFNEIEERGILLLVNLRGIIVCGNDVVIRVDKWLDVRNERRVEVKGSHYIYHARLRSDRRNLIRYCTAHGLDDLHVHQYDLKTGQETAQPRISLDDLPTLGDFIRYAILLGDTARKQL